MKQTKLTIGLLLFMFIGFTMNAFSQGGKEFLANKDAKTTWLGLDFSQVKAMGDLGATPSEMKDKYFVSINELIITESEKYNLPKTFGKTSVSTDLTMVSKINEKIDQEKIKTYNAEELTFLNEEKINKIVAGYNFGDKKGYGIVFIMESLDKTGPLASMYVTVIDMETKKIVVTKKMTGKAAGFGFRNYWAKSIFEVMKDIEKHGL